MKSAATSISDSARTTGEEAKSAARGAASSLKANVADSMNNVKKSYEHVKSDVKSTINKAQAAVKSSTASVKEAATDTTHRAKSTVESSLGDASASVAAKAARAVAESESGHGIAGKVKKAVVTETVKAAPAIMGRTILGDLRSVAMKITDAASSVVDTISEKTSSMPKVEVVKDTEMKAAVDPAHTVATQPPHGSAHAIPLYPTSDAAQAVGTVRASKMTPEQAAAASAATMHHDEHSVKRSILDGPQTMPQGVGKRAIDGEGRPLETGTKDS
jgi:hypothetical protein